MPGRPRKPAMTTVTALTGKCRPVKAETEFKSQRHKKPQAELTVSFQNQRIGSAMIRSSAKSKTAGMRSVAKNSIMTSV